MMNARIEGTDRIEADALGRVTLDLPPPDRLPVDLVLDAAQSASLGDALAAFLAILDDADLARRAGRVSALLTDFGSGEGVPAEIEKTGIPAGHDEVEDFDRFFGVRRVGDEDIAAALARGLFRTAASVLSLASRGPSLSAADMALQTRGFAAQARLLGRVFGLELAR